MSKLVTGSKGHVFSGKRPSSSGGHPIHIEPQRDQAFRPLPDPTGRSPFRLDLKDVVDPAVYAKILSSKRLTFHLNGDMGGIVYGVPQQLVARGMEDDFAEAAREDGEPPAFLYITGDCVYFNGEVKEYYKQFYQPYEFYAGPIFAVPGNHDGENLPGDNSLEGFVRNFCQPTAKKMPEAGDSHRTAMVQPNVYWTLLTPFVNIVGIYSNVPAGGEIQSPQTEWLVNELRTLPESIPLFIALHHPVYSADDHHSGSTFMKRAIDDASNQAGRHPDAVLAGHVHNYQRLTKLMPDGKKQIPYLVTGAGGYHNLHHIMKVDGQRMVCPTVFADKNEDSVTLERYSDDHHGFLRVEIDSEKVMTGRYFEVPRPQEPYSKRSQLLDYFEFDFKAMSYRTNTLTRQP